MLKDFCRVIMKTKSGLKLYLKAGKGNACSWDKDWTDAIWFQTEKDAQDFCKKYFKNFKNYEIEVFKYAI